MKKKVAIFMAICLWAGTFHGIIGMPEVKAAEVQQETNSNSDDIDNYQLESGSMVSLAGKTVQTIMAEDIVKTMGDAPFYLDAETDGDGTLTYESKNPDIVKVDETGKATIVSSGTSKITVTASATDNYSSAKKTVTVTVIPEGYTPVSDISDLYAIRNDPDGNYILVNDIDMSATQKGGDFDCGTGWDSIEEFSGTLDGNGHRIVGMHIFGEFGNGDDIGLFEYCSGSVIVSD